MPTNVNTTNLRINKLTEAQYDTAVQGGVIGPNELSVITDLDDSIQVSTMPTASADELGKVYQFIGTTSASYTHGYFYECVSDGQTPATYSWVQTNVQPQGSSLPSQTGNAGKFLTTDGTDASWSDRALVRKNTNPGGIVVDPDRSTDTNLVDAVLIGKNASSSIANYTVAIGGSSVASKMGAISIGTNSGATAGGATTNPSIAIGRYAKAENEGSIAIGSGKSGGPYANANYAIQLGIVNSGNYTYNSDAKTFKVANGDGNFEMMSADGTIPTARLVHAINKYSTMPTAASTNEGWIVQYTGMTDATYTHGYIYECVSDGAATPTYSWTAVEVQASSGGLPTQTGNADKFLITDGTNASWSNRIPSLQLRGANVWTGGVLTIYGNGNNRIEFTSYSSGTQGTMYAMSGGGLQFVISNADYRMYSSSFVSANASVTLGSSTYKWSTLYATKINNGADIAVPTIGGTMAVMNTPTTMPELAVADWSSNTQTVNVTGVTASNIVFVSPAPASASDYASAGIVCTAQGAGTLTFTCTTTPSNAITVNVVILG